MSYPCAGIVLVRLLLAPHSVKLGSGRAGLVPGRRSAASRRSPLPNGRGREVSGAGLGIVALLRPGLSCSYRSRPSEVGSSGLASDLAASTGRKPTILFWRPDP